MDTPTLAEDLALATPRPREVVARLALAIRGRSGAPFGLFLYGGVLSSISLGHPWDIGAIVGTLGLTAARIGGDRRWANRLARDGVLVDAMIETVEVPTPRTLATFEVDGVSRVATLERGTAAVNGTGKGQALVAPGVRWAWVLAPRGAKLVALGPIALPRAQLRRA